MKFNEIKHISKGGNFESNSSFEGIRYFGND